MKQTFLIFTLTTTAALTLAQPQRAPRLKPVSIEMAQSKLPDKEVQQTLLTVLEAVEAGDYANFVRHASDDWKPKITQEEFDRNAGIAALRMEKGYKVVYLGTMNKPHFTIHLWKLVFDDRGGDVLGEFSIKGEFTGKFDNFHLH